MTLRYLLLASAAILSAAAQQTAPEEPVDPKKLAIIEGSVLNSHTGEALNKVSLTLRVAVNTMNAGTVLPSQTVYVANSDASGKFKLERIEPGSYTLAAERFGYVRNTYNPRQGSVMGATINLSAGQHMKELNLKMLPQAVVSGHIVDEDGDPVLGARIQIMRYIRTRGRRELVSVAGGMTNDLGEYRVHSIPPGRYYVAAMPPPRYSRMNETIKSSGPIEEFVNTYFPGSTDETAARQIELTAGQSLPGLDVKIKKSAVFRIQGKFTGLPPPVKYLRLNLIPRGKIYGLMLDNTTEVKADGSFEFSRTSPGAYEIVIQVAGPSQGRTFPRTPVDVSKEDLTGIVINAADPITITGKVRVDGNLQELEQKLGKPVSLADTRVSFFAFEGIAFTAPSGLIGEDLAFAAPNASMDRFRITMNNLPEGLWLKAATTGGRDVLESGLDLGSGPVEPLEIVLGVGTGSVTGTANDSSGKPLQGIMVTLFTEPYKDAPDAVRTATTDQHGGFKLLNLKPGTYKIYAWEVFDLSTNNEPEFLKKYSTDAKQIEIKPNSAENLSLKPIPPAN